MRLNDKLREMVREECQKETNPFGYTAFIHIRGVVKYAKLLAQKFGVDEEICELSAWLHDWGSLIGKYEDHHIVGAEEAERILKGFNYPQDKIEKVKYCILTHRGNEDISKDLKRKTLEAKILSSADAMSHFADIPDLFHLAYFTKGLSYENGKEFVKGKLQRDWKKIMPTGKEIIREYYEAALKILKDDT